MQKSKDQMWLLLSYLEECISLHRTRVSRSNKIKYGASITQKLRAYFHNWTKRQATSGDYWSTWATNSWKYLEPIIYCKIGAIERGAFNQSIRFGSPNIKSQWLYYTIEVWVLDSNVGIRGIWGGGLKPKISQQGNELADTIVSRIIY